MLIKKTEKMKQTERQKLIAAAMEEEKSKLFCYACYRLGDEKDAEDILQDLFITLSRSPEIVEKASNLNNYIFRCLANNCTTLLHQKSKLHFVQIDSSEAMEQEPCEPQNFEQEYTMINRLLSIIPQEQSEVIRLHIHAGRTFRQIAEILEIPEASAKSRYRYGIEKLRANIKKEV